MNYIKMIRSQLSGLLRYISDDQSGVNWMMRSAYHGPAPRPRKQFSAAAPGKEYEHLPLVRGQGQPLRKRCDPIWKKLVVKCVPTLVWMVSILTHEMSALIQTRQMPSCIVSDYIYIYMTVLRFCFWGHFCALNWFTQRSASEFVAVLGEVSSKKIRLRLVSKVALFLYRLWMALVF